MLLPQEWLADNLDRLDPIRGAGEGKAFKLMGHCTERTNAPSAESQWSAVFAKLGVPFVALEVGCCGMAGTFGHEVRNRALSQQIYKMSWEPEINAADQRSRALGHGLFLPIAGHAHELALNSSSYSDCKRADRR